MTHDLAIGLRTRLEDAERIKLKLSDERNTYMSINHSQKEELLDVSEFGLEEDTIPKTFLYDVIDARLNEIFKLVTLELEKAHLTNKLPAGAVITGGGALTAALPKSAKKYLKMPIRVGSPRGITGLIDEIQGPAFSASVGCILYGVKAMRSNSDLSFDAGRGNISNIISNAFSRLKSFLP